MQLYTMNRDEVFSRIVSILEENGAKKVAVFGSYARGESKPGSDIDILVEFTERKSLLSLVGLEMKLTEALQIKVDLLTLQLSTCG